MRIDSQTQAFITAHRNEDVRALALKYANTPSIDLTQALTQIEGWQKACEKLPSWAKTEGIIYPPLLSMEQCSSELTALYKCKIIDASSKNHTSFTDLTGGFGIDFSYIAPLFQKATYVERQAVLCELATANFQILGLPHVKVCCADSEDYLPQMPNADWIFLDPARRSHSGSKVFAIEDCEPNLLEIQELLLEKAEYIMVKLSPMQDIHQALKKLPNVQEVHVVSVDNECKELLLVMSKRSTQQPPIIVAAQLFSNGNDPQLFRFTWEEELTECAYTSEVGSYLYEPNAALLKAGAYRSVARHWNLEKLHPNSHLYTSKSGQPDFPGRIFHVEGYAHFSKAELKTLLQDVEKANLTVRNFPQSVAELRKKLKLKEGGDTYLFATTLQDGSRVLIKCRR